MKRATVIDIPLNVSIGCRYCDTDAMHHIADVAIATKRKPRRTRWIGVDKLPHLPPSPFKRRITHLGICPDCRRRH